MTRRRFERPTYGGYWGRWAKAMSKPYMPWQQYIADVAGEVDHRGRLCYKKVVITVPRQSGKTTLILPMLVGRAEAKGDEFGGRQIFQYTAQTREDARKKLMQEYIPAVESAKALRGRFKKRLSVGQEGLTFHSSGSMLGLVATGQNAGHGPVLDVGVLDEAMSQADGHVVEGAWEPATLTRPMAQIWIPSTAGHANSTYFRGVVDRARQATIDDTGFGTAYIEFSADETADGFDPYDEDLWWRTMPALGHTQDIEAVRTIATGGMDLPTWMRAHLNIWVGSTVPSVMDAAKWKHCRQPGAERKTRPVISFDISADRDWGSISMTALDPRGMPMSRLIDYRANPSEWMVGRLVELRDDEGYDCIRPFVADSVGPVRSLKEDLENAYVDVHWTTTGELVGACGALFDAVRDLKYVHWGEPALEQAQIGAAKRKLGDAWAWTRTESAADAGIDISPLVSHTVGLFGQLRYGEELGGSFEGSFG